jgi:hypothetical protein
VWVNLGLAAAVLLRVEGGSEALLSQVLVPQLGELLMLLVKLGVVAVIGAIDKAAPNVPLPRNRSASSKG